MLLGQHYESIKGDAKHGMRENFKVDLEEAHAALERAKDHAALWIEEHGKWMEIKIGAPNKLLEL